MSKLNITSLKGYFFSLIAAILTYMFYVLIVNNEEKYFTIPLEVIFPPQYVTSSPIIPSVRVTLQGSPASLARVNREDMNALLNLSHIQSEGIVYEFVQLKRQGTFEQIDNLLVEIEPAEIEVILESRIIREIRIKPAFSNSLPKGYAFENFSVFPSNVEISGPQSIVEDIAEITTESIDLSLLSYSSTRSTKLLIPQFTTLASLSTQEVRVYIKIQEIEFVQTYNNLTVNVNKLSDTLRISNIIPQISLVIKGPQLIIEELKPSVFIDVTSVQNPGSYTFDVQASIPEELDIISITPDTVNTTFVPIEYQPDTNNTIPDLSPSINIEIQPEALPLSESAPAQNPIE